MSAIKRLTKEYNDLSKTLTKEISENVSTGPVNENNLLHWNATIFGAMGTPYAGGVFKLDIKFPNNYPFVPPVVRFQTRMFHPNISERGDICLDILKNHWSPAYTVTQVLLSIVSLLSDPNPDDPLNPDAAELYKFKKSFYNDRVVEYVREFASEFVK